MKGLAKSLRLHVGLCVLVTEHRLTGHLIEQRKIDRRERRDHVLLTVSFPDQLVVSLRQLTDFLFTSVLGRGQEEGFVLRIIF